MVCDYKLLPERVGGMDYFFWLFDQKCKTNHIEVDWFFPNNSNHGGYSKMNIIDSNHEKLELFFYKYCATHKPLYSTVFTHFIELGIPIFKRIKQITSAKIISVDHNPRPIEGYPLEIKIKKRLKGLLYAKYINVFVSVSEFSRKELIKELGSLIRKKTIVIYNGMEIEKFKKKTNFEFKGRFIVASHLRVEKGIQDLILAVNETVKEGNFDFTIDIYGNGLYRETLEEMVRINSLERYINFKGSVADLNTIYHHYDYLIHPSHGETFCYSVVESLLCNLPVITTKNHGNVLGMVIENKNGFLFEREDICGLKNILLKVLKKEIVIGDGTEINNAVNHFSLEEMVDNYIRLVQ